MRDRLAVTVSAVVLALAYTLFFCSGAPPAVEPDLDLAESHFERGHYGRCEQICVAAIGRAEQKQGERSVEIVRAESLLTRLYLHLGMARLADRHCQRGLRMCQSIHGNRHPDVAEFHALMRHIWNLYSGDGDSGGSQEAIEILKPFVGESDPRLIVALEAQAGDCYDRWTPDDAARAVSIAEIAYGKRHPVYGRCLSTLAKALRHTRDFDQADRISKQAIEVLTSSLGPEHPELWSAYRNLASVERERGHSDQADALLQNSIRLRFSTLSDADLCRFFQQFMDSSQYLQFDDGGVSDMYLTEMTRRGGDVIQRFLTRKISGLRREYLQVLGEQHAEDLYDDEDERFSDALFRLERLSRNLPLVTALCRIQNKPDPLQIFITGPDELTCEFPDLPALDVTIQNVDAERREIGFKESGDYRSGRQARWRIEAKNAAGAVQPFHELRGIIMGGGIFNPTTLKFGEGWETTLAMASFVETLEPGEYEVRVLYHNELTIVDWEFATDLIVCRSAPFKLTVQPRSIEIAPEQRNEIYELLARFDERQTCKIIDGEYGPWAHEFVDPQSDYGRLLTIGWPTVPILIEELEHPGQSLQRRAHLLALLFSITGENDPRSPADFWGYGESSALGTYESIEQGWGISSKRAGEDKPGSAGFGFPSDPATRTAKLDAAAQTPVIERWKLTKQRLKLTPDS